MKGETPPLTIPLDCPSGGGLKGPKFSVRQRVLAWLRRSKSWRTVKALAGHRPQVYTQEDYASERVADRIRAVARWSAAWALPLATCIWLYMVGRHPRALTKDVDELLRSVLTAASLTSGLLAAGLMNATAQNKELRRRRVDALRQCQKELQPIRRAFDMLAISFNDRANKRGPLTRFLDCVWRVGFEWHAHDGSDTGGRLIGIEKISDIVRALDQLSATLGRAKHYRYLVEELGGGPAGDVNGLHGVVLTTWEGVRNAVERIRPEAAVDSWCYLSFWEDLINDTLELATWTQWLSIEVHYHNPTRLRVMFAHHAWLAEFGAWLRLHFLPPYCPKENRIERLWLDLHANVTCNRRRSSKEGSLEYVPGHPAERFDALRRLLLAAWCTIRKSRTRFKTPPRASRSTMGQHLAPASTGFETGSSLLKSAVF